MPLVNVLINGRAYTVACDDGEETRLRELGQYLDKKVRELAGTIGAQAGDSRLLLMAGLVVCDELSEALSRIKKLEENLAAVGSAGSAQDNDETALAAEFLEKAAARIESIAERAARS